MNAIIQNTKITSTDINSLISELNGKLNLSGGTMTGNLTLANSLFLGTNPSEVPLIGGTQDTSKNPFIQFYNGSFGTDPGKLRFVACRADGSRGILELLPEGTAKLGGNAILTSAGGTMTGNVVNRNVDNGYIYIAGGTGTGGAPNSGALVAWGKDHAYGPGCAALQANNGTASSELRLFPNGKATLAGNDVLTSASGLLMNQNNVVAGTVSGGSYTLPSGGAWAYIFMRGQYDGNAVASGVAAGGTTVSTGDNGTHAYFAIRIA